MNTLQKPGIALDIDDTLAFTSLACVTQLYSRFGHTITDPLELIRKYGYPHLIPEWQLPECQEHLSELFRGEELYASLEPIPDTVPKVTQLSQTIPITCYITSRPTNLYDVSKHWLENKGFPDAPLICRDRSVINRPDWKIEYLATHFPQLLALIDNEIYVPLNVSFSFSLLELVQYQKVSPPHEKLIECHDWDEVISQIRLLAT